MSNYVVAIGTAWKAPGAGLPRLAVRLAVLGAWQASAVGARCVPVASLPELSSGFAQPPAPYNPTRQGTDVLQSTTSDRWYLISINNLPKTLIRFGTARLSCRK